MDLRTIAEAQAAAAGVDLPTALWEVLQAMLDRARSGDTGAAKLILDKLAPEPAASLRLSTVQPMLVITGVPQPGEDGG